jgi:RimJ/RimL family protein N-acetyltransferase
VSLDIYSNKNKHRSKEQIPEPRLQWPKIIHLDEVDAMFDAIVRDSTGEYERYLSWVKRNYNSHFPRLWLKGAIQQNLSKKKYTQLIMSSGGIAGVIDYAICTTPSDRFAQIGYFKHPDSNDKGVMTQSVIQVSSVLLDQGIQPCLDIEYSNTKSIALAYRAGFIQVPSRHRTIVSFEKQCDTTY